MRKIEETILQLVYPPKWKNNHFVSVAKWASQTCTEFGTHVKMSVPFPVVTPTKTGCLIKQRPQFITLINSWLGHQWKGDDIHTDRAYFQRSYSKLQRRRGRESFCPDLGQSCYSDCWCVSVSASPLTTTCLPRHLWLSRLSSWAPEGRRQRGALRGQNICCPSGEVKQTNVELNKPANSQTKHIQENTKMPLLLMSINSPPQ